MLPFPNQLEETMHSYLPLTIVTPFEGNGTEENGNPVVRAVNPVTKSADRVDPYLRQSEQSRLIANRCISPQLTLE